jgi:hypothetical protein
MPKRVEQDYHGTGGHDSPDSILDPGSGEEVILGALAECPQTAAGAFTNRRDRGANT